MSFYDDRSDWLVWFLVFVVPLVLLISGCANFVTNDHNGELKMESIYRGMSCDELRAEHVLLVKQGADAKARADSYRGSEFIPIIGLFTLPGQVAAIVSVDDAKLRRAAVERLLARSCAEVAGAK
ncbi:MAG: hypothetical protein IPI06_13970 [Gammaproteobacteria bacterium]|nr:hypothetical protein [Gammaproteobacteria bacterium]